MFQQISDPSGLALIAIALLFLVWFAFEIYSTAMLFGVVETEIKALHIDIKTGDLEGNAKEGSTKALNVRKLFSYPRNGLIFDTLYLGRWTPVVFCVVLVASVFSALMVVSQNSSIYFVFLFPILMGVALNHSRMSTQERIENLKKN